MRPAHRARAFLHEGYTAPPIERCARAGRISVTESDTGQPPFRPAWAEAERALGWPTSPDLRRSSGIGGPVAIGLVHPLCRPQPEDTRIVRITQNMIPESLHQSINARLVMLGVMDL